MSLNDGFRPNVGIVLANAQGRLFWGQRIGQSTWQFPQGGIKAGETPTEAMYRELMEEVGLTVDDVKILGWSKGWLRYRLPEYAIREKNGRTYLGQKQRWVLLRFVGDEQSICLNKADKPEFDAWRWVDYWYPVLHIVSFKRIVYQRALAELEHYLQRDTG